MNVPVFIEIEVEEQAEELRAYFKSLGAEITSERSDKGFEDDLHKIIGVCDACFRETNAKDVQAVGFLTVAILNITLVRGLCNETHKVFK